MLLTITYQCNQSVDKIYCEKVIKKPKKFNSIPELEFLGKLNFCQVLFSQCNIIFQKSRFDKVSVAAYTECDKISIDFSLDNSFTSDIFKVIVPSIDKNGDYTISFISENNFMKRRKKLIKALLTKDNKKHHKILEKTYRKHLNLIV